MNAKTASRAAREQEPSNVLNAGSIGVASIVFFVVAAAAPLGATLGVGPAVFMFAGVGAPAMYLVASIALLLFAVGFAAMSKYVTNAGGFAPFVSWGLGRRAGHAAAGVAILAYFAMYLGISAQFAIFTTELFQQLAGISVPWQVTLIVGTIIIGLLGYRDVRVSTAILGVILILELLILVAFDAAVLVQGGAEGINFDSFVPSASMSPTTGLALLFAFASFVGFESATLYGEEARDPKKTVPRATYAAVIVIGVTYTLTIWALALAYGTGNVQEAAANNPVGFVTAAMDRYMGPWAGVAAEILVVTSLVAVLLSFHNTASRYLFSLGRAGFLSKRLGQSHPRYRSPSRASILVSGVVVALAAAFMLTGADPYSVLYMWMVGLGTLGVVLLQTAGAAAVVTYFRIRQKGEPIWAATLAPAAGGLLLLVALLLAVTNFGELIGDEGIITILLPTLYLVASIAGIATGLSRNVEDLRIEHLPESAEPSTTSASN